MLLHSGSGLHKHQYSAPTSPNTNTVPILKKSNLVRSSYPSLNSSLARYDREIKPLSSILKPDTRRHTVGVSFVDQVIMEDDQRTDTMSVSDDGKSLTSRDGSEANSLAGGRRSSKRRKSRKDKTLYALAHPAPTLLQKQHLLHLRPQLLLQLQRVSNERRPLPVLDVLPSAVFVPRLSKKFPIMFKGRGGLGPYDILCVKSEDYCIPDRDSSGSDSDEEGWTSRQVEAVICQTKKGDAKATGQAEIVFNSGSKWTAVPLSSNIYEFTNIHEDGVKTTARWVRKCSVAQRSNADMGGDKLPSTPVPKMDTKFNFSIINPNSRRHPVIASITTNSLEIPDTYTLLTPSVTKSCRSTGESNSSVSVNDDSESIVSQDEPQERTTVPVSEFLRKLIQVTGVWVALRQGWSPSFRYDDFSPPCQVKGGQGVTNTPVSTNSFNCHSRHRSASVDRDNRAGAQTPESLHSSSAGISRKIKWLIGQRSQINVAPATFNDEGRNRPGLTKQPMRSSSTGAVFMAKVAARRANSGQGTSVPRTVPSDGHSEESVAGEREGSQIRHSFDFVGVNGSKPKRMSSPSQLAVVESRTTHDGNMDVSEDSSVSGNETLNVKTPQQMGPVSMPALKAAEAKNGAMPSGRKNGWKGKVLRLFRRSRR